MLTIETQGAWRDMGARIGEEFRGWFPRVFEHFARWLRDDMEGYRPIIGGIADALRQHCPHLQEETEGMAEALGVDPEFLLGFRYFNELKARRRPGCSGLFIADSDRGPLLARTCDIEPDIGAEIQMLRVNRPNDGPATALVTYLGLTGGVGFNEHGLALVGSSATANVPPEAKDADGLPIAVVNELMMTTCRDVPQAAALLSRHRVKGKGANELLADADARSLFIELVPGREIIQTPCPEGHDWQACSNFCYSKGLTMPVGPAYLENAYARYGRIVHQVAEGLMDRTLEGVKQLFTEIAQPGMVCAEEHCTFHTAYAFVVEPANRRMHITLGHPAREPWTEVAL